MLHLNNVCRGPLDNATFKQCWQRSTRQCYI